MEGGLPLAPGRYQPMVYVIRSVHMVIGLTMTAATFYLWYAGLFGVFNAWTWLAVVLLAVQWIIIMLNRGDCPMGRVHARYGDEKTLFELVAGKQYAIHGFRNWGIACAAGGILLAIRLMLSR
jgi:hypothetical protein